MINSDSFAYYDLLLKQNNKYTIYYEYNGMFAQFIELDTRSNTSITDKLEYLLPDPIKDDPKQKSEIKYLLSWQPNRENLVGAEFGDVC